MTTQGTNLVTLISNLLKWFGGKLGTERLAISIPIWTFLNIRDTSVAEEVDAEMERAIEEFLKAEK